MAMPLYFEPDDTLEDSDMLGYGDVIYDDGTRHFVPGDPEVAASLPRPPPMDAPQNDVGLPPGHQIDMATGTINTGVQDPNTGELIDPGLPSQASMGALGKIGAGLGKIADAQSAIMSGAPPPGQAPPASPAVDVLAAPVAPPPAAAAQQSHEDLGMGISMDGQLVPKGSPDDGMHVVERRGALPPDVAAQQSSQLANANNSALQAAMHARDMESQIMRSEQAKRAGVIAAEKEAQDAALKEQQAKQERLLIEQQTVTDSKIATDLVSAEGWGGSIMSILGAALLGAVGSDAGLRMIDNTIDRNMKKQLAIRDSRLNILAKQLGSTSQAMAGTKALIYKNLQEKAENLKELTKADVYDAHTPEIIAGINQKNVEAQQKHDTESLGKTIEKVTPPPKPADVQKYAEAAGAQSQAQIDAERAVRAIGGIYDPKTGRITNRDEILKNGIPGVGAWDTFIKDLGKLPFGIGSIPQAADNAITSKRGTEVRAALEGLVAAKASERNPGRAPTDADRDAARIELGLTTEEGVVNALERLMGNQGNVKARNVAAYGEAAAGTYDQRLQGQGVKPKSGTSPGESRPATPEDIQRELANPRASGPQANLGNSIDSYAKQEGLNPEAVKAVIGHESGGSASATNKLTGKHAGLIQFSEKYWPSVAKAAGHPEVSWEDMRKLTPEEQLPFVMAYFRDKGLSEHSDPGDYAMAAFMPAYLGKPDDFVLGEKGSSEMMGDVRSSKVWEQNPGLRGQDGRITVGSVRRSVGM
jgi:hypothetical protein